MLPFLFLAFVFTAPGWAYGQCPAGTFILGGGSTVSCAPCPAGQSQPAPDQIACIPCVVGTYQDTLGSTSCNVCTAGTANPETGSASPSACLVCNAGTYSAAGAASCTGCNPGTFNPTSGSGSASACTNCSPGTVQPESGKGSCNLCAIGTFQSTSGQTACALCPSGAYTFVLGSAACTSCPPTNSKLKVLLSSLKKGAGRVKGRIEGTFMSSNAQANAIRPDLYGFKIILEDSRRRPRFTALLSAGANWTKVGRTWRYSDQTSSATVPSASVELRKMGPTTQLIVKATIKRATITLVKADLPLILTVGFGPNGTAPCSRSKFKSSQCRTDSPVREVNCKS